VLNRPNYPPPSSIPDSLLIDTLRDDIDNDHVHLLLRRVDSPVALEIESSHDKSLIELRRSLHRRPALFQPNETLFMQDVLDEYIY
jgi:hypothetical protein